MTLPDPLTSRAVLIGSSQYEHLPKLPAVDHNLTTLSELLQSEDLCGLPAKHCVVVRNPQTIVEMLDPLNAAAEAARDTLIVYFAGHGLVHSTGSDLYLALAGSDMVRMYRSVAYNYIRSELRVSRARRRLVILDSCYSGRALDVLSGADDPTVRVANGAALSGTYLMAATAENRTAQAGDRYTAFSGELISLIREGLPEQPELLDVDTLFEHVRIALEDKGLPIPQKRETDFGAGLTLFRNRAYLSGKGALPIERYGVPSGVEPDTWFRNRRALYDAGVHRQLQAGICGTAERGGAESIVVSGGYKDDVDYGRVIVYTGHGGRDPNTGVQIKDQYPDDPGNAALIKSMMTRLPVRVIRGAGGDTEFSPPNGYSYDGLFVVTDYWTKTGVDGRTVLQFRLEQVADTDSRGAADRSSPRISAGRWEQVAKGIYADRSLASDLKQLYEHACQICGTVLEVPGGVRFAATVYIRGLELPHSGPDAKENMLCLCSNHRDLFKYGAITIEDDLSVIDQTDGEVIGRLESKHEINLDHVRYHREHHVTGQRRLIDDLD